MTLPKHLRPRWRYLAVGIETWPDASVSRDAFTGALEAATRTLHGDPGAAAVEARVLSVSVGDGTGEALLRVRRGDVERARAALACVGHVSGHPVGLRVRGVSGTVRACEERYLGRASAAAEERTVAFADGDREAVVRADAVDVRLPDGFAGATDLDLE